MNIRDLRYLVSLAKHHHFRTAAEDCFVSQPALSMQIKKMEHELGVTLFERYAKKVFLTEIGARLAEKAQTILTCVEDMKVMARLDQDPDQIHLKWGMIPTIAPYVLPHFIPLLHQAYPTLRLYLIEEKTSELIKKLTEGSIDLAFLALPMPNSTPDVGLITYPCFHDPFLLAMPFSHLLSNQRDAHDINLEHQPLLFLEEGHCLRDQTVSFCKEHLSSKIQPYFQGTSLETIRYMIASGLGMAFMPQLAYRANDGLRYLKFSKPSPFRELGLICRESSTKIDMIQKIVTLIQTHTHCFPTLV